MLNFISNHFLKLSLIFYAFGFAQNALIVFGERGFSGLFPWKLTQFYVNYFDFGFVKRGIVGTLLYPLFSQIGGQVAVSTVAVIVIDFFLFLLIILFLKKGLNKVFPASSEIRKLLMAIIVLSPVGVMQLSYDSGRLDHVNFLLVGCAMLFVLERKFILAGIALSVGVLTHEAVFFYGFPVLLASCLVIAGREGGMSDRMTDLIGFGLPPTLAAGLVAFQGNANPDLASVLPFSMLRGADVWGRGVFELSLNLSIAQYIVLLIYLVMPYVLLWKFYKANSLRVDLVFISTLVPLTLFVLGIDYARWTHLVFVSAVLAILFHAANGKTAFSARELGFARPGLFFYILPLGPIGIARALPYIEAMVLRMQSG